ncbi:MAG: SBBP repeat-containing protein, partial [Tepidisphaeraceae bacterium]
MDSTRSSTMLETFRRSFCPIEALEPRALLAVNPVIQGGKTYDSAFATAASPDGSYVVAGIFSGTAGFGSGPGAATFTSSGDTDFYVAKYSASGSLLWVKQFGGDAGELDQDGFIDCAIDPGRAEDFDEGVGVQSLQLGEYVNAVACDSANNIYVTGAFRGTVDFNPGPKQTIITSTDGDKYLDIYFLKLSPSGGIVYAKQLGGEFTDLAQSIAVDSAQNVYLTG